MLAGPKGELVEGKERWSGGTFIPEDFILRGALHLEERKSRVFQRTGLREAHWPDLSMEARA